MEYKVTLTQQELAVICRALGELPLKLSLNLFIKLQEEQKAQDEKNAIPIESLNQAS